MDSSKRCRQGRLDAELKRALLVWIAQQIADARPEQIEEMTNVYRSVQVLKYSGLLFLVKISNKIIDQIWTHSSDSGHWKQIKKKQAASAKLDSFCDFHKKVARKLSASWLVCKKAAKLSSFADAASFYSLSLTAFKSMEFN